VQNSLCVQVLRSPMLAALLHGTPAAGVSQTVRHGTRNGITELSKTAPLYIRLGGHHVGHGPTFLVFLSLITAERLSIFGLCWVYTAAARWTDNMTS